MMYEINGPTFQVKALLVLQICRIPYKPIAVTSDSLTRNRFTKEIERGGEVWKDSRKGRGKYR